MYGYWPKSGEIDLVQFGGNSKLFNDHGLNIGTEMFQSNLHFGTEIWNDAYWSSTFSKRSTPGWGWNRDFHVYQMEWTPSIIFLSFLLLL